MGDCSGSTMSLEKLAKKFKFHYSIAKKLLEQCSNAQSGEFLERKIQSLEVMIARTWFDIDDESLEDGMIEEFYEEWCEMMIPLWQHLFDVVAIIKASPSTPGQSTTDFEIDNTNVINAKPSTLNSSNSEIPQSSASIVPSTSVAPEPVTIRNDSNQNRVRSERFSKIPAQKTTFRSSTYSSSNRKHSESNDSQMPEDEQKKLDIRVRLSEKFGQLTAAKDINGIRPVLLEVGMAVNILSRYRSDQALQRSVLEFALAKLPEDLQNKFDQHCNQIKERTMYALKFFLVDQLGQYYRSLPSTSKRSRRQEVNPKGDESSENDDNSQVEDEEDHESSDACPYCKAVGHSKKNCPELKNLVCFRCFYQGHKARQCPLKCRKCGRYGHTRNDCRL